MRLVFACVRVVAGGGILAAVFAQLLFSLTFDIPDVGRFLTNYFSFFTIQSNLLAGVVLLIGAWYGFVRSEDSQWYNIARYCLVAYMVTTGVVYNLLLRGVELDQAMTLDWSNEILHLAGPIYLFLDWLFAPGRRVVEWRRFWIVLAFPMAWLVYTMIRGPIADWYPYPFLNPALADNGYGSVIVYILAIAAFIGGIGTGLVGISRSRWPGWASDDVMPAVERGAGSRA